jgi:sugar O-acyltransferase (sialic acid O-acetyltransferase NeuD family)
MGTDRLVIVGAGGFGRELMCWAAEAVGASWDRIAFVDDDPQALEGHGFGPDLPWAGTFADFAPAPGDRCVVALGEPATKQRVVEALREKNAVFATLVHPSAVIARTAQLGEGCVVCPLAFMSANARLAEFVTVNVLSSVGHDVVVGAFSTLSAHVDLTGGVVTGPCAFFGSGARVTPKVSIGAHARVGAGATVMRAVPDGVTVFALPAKRL